MVRRHTTWYMHACISSSSSSLGTGRMGPPRRVTDHTQKMLPQPPSARSCRRYELSDGGGGGGSLGREPRPGPSRRSSGGASHRRRVRSGARAAARRDSESIEPYLSPHPAAGTRRPAAPRRPCSVGTRDVDQITLAALERTGARCCTVLHPRAVGVVVVVPMRWAADGQTGVVRGTYTIRWIIGWLWLGCRAIGFVIPYVLGAPHWRGLEDEEGCGICQSSTHARATRVRYSCAQAISHHNRSYT
ncbi:hypothetical protein GY45DRAFT_1039809 [Cubamyces sp. BRFM 1775]|nr:hypothetical protein GY45DRAFT_1039809 [Cubamyces sp. BRFM 1775]